MEKRAIAARAAELIGADSSIIVDGGTTTFALVEFLRDTEIRVLTPSFPLANELLNRTQAQVTVPGGPLYRDQQLILSPFDEPVIQGYVANLLFMGVQGVSERGLLQSDPMLVQAQRNLLERAERLVVLADSTKFDPAGNLVVCPLERVDVFITDAGAAPASLALLRDAGAEVLVVDKLRPRRNRTRKTETPRGSD
jgi:DeoR family ulaG and ulaABCDEF operon transcriptional repressor